MTDTDRRFHGTLEDVENISFHSRKSDQVADQEAIERANDLGYEVMGPDGKIDKERLGIVKAAIAKTEQPSPKLDAIVAALKRGQN